MGYDPLASVDEFPYVFTNFERANNFADSYDRRLSGTKLKKEHFLSQKIDSIPNLTRKEQIEKSVGSPV